MIKLNVVFTRILYPSRVKVNTIEINTEEMWDTHTTCLHHQFIWHKIWQSSDCENSVKTQVGMMTKWSKQRDNYLAGSRNKRVNAML